MKKKQEVHDYLELTGEEAIKEENWVSEMFCIIDESSTLNQRK